MTRKEIEQLYVVEPYCFESDNAELWYKVGLSEGLEAADKEPRLFWISTKDDLPYKHDEFISSCDKRVTVDVLSIVRNTICINKMHKLNGRWVWLIGKPRYWFPIPKLPEFAKT